MTAREFQIKPCGPFAWNASLDMLANWQPVAHFPRRAGVVTVAFGLDGSFAPAGAQLRFEGDALVGRVSDGADIDAVDWRVARMFSLDVDATDYPLVGRRDPALGRMMRAHPGLRPVLFPFTVRGGGVGGHVTADRAATGRSCESGAVGGAR